MISDKLSAKYSVVTKINEASILNMGDKVVALVFSGEGNKISSKTAEWAANALKEIEDKYNGVVVFGNDENLCSGNAVESNEDLANCAKAFQSLTTTIRHYSKPVVTLLKGQSVGFGYEIALNSHAVIACPKVVKFGYDFSQGLTPMGGGLTAQIIDTYAIGDNVAGHDIIPFLKVLLNNVYAPKKVESIFEAKAKDLLPKNTFIIKEDEDIIEKGKQKVLNMFNEGFDKVEQKSVTVSGTTGRAALEITIVNRYEGLFMPKAIYQVALKIAGIICGGNVPKKTLILEQQFLNLEAQAFASVVEQKRNEVIK